MDVYDLADRLYARLGPDLDEASRRNFEQLMSQDMQVAALDLVTAALKADDVTPAEVTAAIDCARAGEFLKSSRWLLGLLLDYQRTHAA